MKRPKSKSYISKLLTCIYWFIGFYVVAVLIGLACGMNEPTTLTTCVFAIGLGESGLTALIRRAKLKSNTELKTDDGHMKKILTIIYAILGAYTLIVLAIYYFAGPEPVVLTTGLFGAVLGESGWCSSIQLAKYKSEISSEDDSDEMPISSCKK